MFRALFSTRALQQLLREGRLASDSLGAYSIMLNIIVLPCFILAVFRFYTPYPFADSSPLFIYGMVFGSVLLGTLLSNFFLFSFCTLFDFQEQKFLYIATKAMFRFYNAGFLVFTIPLFWYTILPQLIFFLYLPLFFVLFVSFFIRFVSNINAAIRIQFFIYFCTFEILPYVLIVKLIVDNL
jgi:hypothetical protein